MSTMATNAPVVRNRRSVISRIWAAYELGRSRARLRELPDHMLADIGLSRRDAHTESGRPFWDLPGWWRN